MSNATVRIIFAIIRRPHLPLKPSTPLIR
jgi:hypothetical protein